MTHIPHFRKFLSKIFVESGAMKLKQLALSCPLFVLCLSGSSAFANADVAIAKRFFTLDPHPVIHERVVSDNDALATAPTTIHNEADEFAPVDTLVNAGKAIWSIVESGKPSSQIQSNFAYGIPHYVEWQSLDGWKAPVARDFDFAYKNFLGMETVKFTYRIHYTYGGRYKGNGQYLTNVTVKAAKVYLFWGSKLSANAEVPSVMNVGTIEDPIAGMMLLISWQASSLFSHFEDSMSYFIRGEGSLEALKFAEK